MCFVERHIKLCKNWTIRFIQTSASWIWSHQERPQDRGKRPERNHSKNCNYAESSPHPNKPGPGSATIDVVIPNFSPWLEPLSSLTRWICHKLLELAKTARIQRGRYGPGFWMKLLATTNKERSKDAANMRMEAIFSKTLTWSVKEVNTDPERVTHWRRIFLNLYRIPFSTVKKDPKVDLSIDRHHRGGGHCLTVILVIKDEVSLKAHLKNAFPQPILYRGSARCLSLKTRPYSIQDFWDNLSLTPEKLISAYDYSSRRTDMDVWISGTQDAKLWLESSISSSMTGFGI